MPQITEIAESDEEYQDADNGESATSIPPKEDTATPQCSTSDPHHDIVEEIIKQQTNMHLDDDDDSAKGASNAMSDDKKSTPSPEYVHDEVDEEALKEKEQSLTEEELEANKDKANIMKLKANELFKNNECEQAIDIYTDALQICPLRCNKERAVLYGNRAAAKIKIDSKKSALDDCCKAIELWPDYVRALLRRAKLYEHEDKLDEALEDYKRVYELDPGQREALEATARLPPIINERNERLKEEMMGKLKDLGNMILKPFGLSTSNFQMQQDPSTGSYSINFNQNPS